MLGRQYAAMSDPKVIMSSGRYSNDNYVLSSLARLRGMRFVSMNEAEAGQTLNMALVKQLTGGDTVQAKFMRKDAFEFVPQFKVWLRTNDVPRIVGGGEAEWRRIILIPFEHQIREAVDRHIIDARMNAEAPGILNWAIGGLREYLEIGLNPPERVRMAVDEYKTENDILAQFLEDATIADPTAYTKKSQVYRAYKEWARAQGISYPWSAHMLTKQMRKRGYEDKKKDGNKSWMGLALRPEWSNELVAIGGM